MEVVKKAAKTPARLLTLAEFRRKYGGKEDGFKYEFNNGALEKSPSAMKVKQVHIINNLQRRFTQTQAYQAGDALVGELELFTSSFQLRKPDLAWLPKAKMLADDESVSGFVVEVISPTDSYRRVFNKLKEYFVAGVQVVWHIIPEDEQVYVYTSPTRVAICEGDTICSAAPALPDFEIAAADIFRK